MNFALNKHKLAIFLSFINIICLVLLSLFVFITLKMDPKTAVSTFPVSENREPLKKIRVVATAYSSESWQTDDAPCIPADGYDLCEHYKKYGEGNTIAANFLPFGSHIKLPEVFGEKVFVVHDRMNGKYGYGRIDVWMPTQAEAKAFGVKYMEMELYGGYEWKVASK